MGYVYDANKSKPWRKPRWRFAYNGPDGTEVNEKGASTESATEHLLKMREKDVASGCWSALPAASGAGGVPTFTEYATRHDAHRRSKGKALALDGTEHGRINKHVVPIIGKVLMDRFEREHIAGVLESLMEKIEKGELAPSTVLNIYGDLRVLFKRAVRIDKFLAESPCTLSLDLDELPQKRDKDPRWRKTAKFARKELLMVIPFHAGNHIPADRHMIYALAYFGFMRTGEAAGRRWLDWDEMQEPLEQILVATQYNDKETKTRRPRMLPVHPALSQMLREFRDHWWPILYGRRPRPEDFIVPVRGRGKPRADKPRPCRSKQDVYKLLQADLVKLGLRRRRQHDFRRTMISDAQAGGCNRQALKDISHGAKGDIISDYTTFDWEDLCAVILCVKFELPTQHAPELRVLPNLVGPFASKADVVRQFPLDMPADEVVQLAESWGVTRMDVYTTRRLMRLEASDGVSRSRFGASLTPGEKALVAVPVSALNHSRIGVTPTGIEPGQVHENAGELSATGRTKRVALVDETARNLPGRDQPLTPRVSAPADEVMLRAELLDLQDELRSHADSLRRGEALDERSRHALASAMDRAARLAAPEASTHKPKARQPGGT